MTIQSLGYPINPSIVGPIFFNIAYATYYSSILTKFLSIILIVEKIILEFRLLILVKLLSKISSIISFY